MPQVQSSPTPYGMHMALTLRQVEVTSNIVAFLECPLPRPDEIDPGATGPHGHSFVDHRRSRPQLAERAPCRLPAQCLASERRDRRWNCSAVIDAKIALAVFLTTASAAPLRTVHTTAAIRMPAHPLNDSCLSAKPADLDSATDVRMRTLSGAVTRHHRQALPGRRVV